jgi:RNA polymerase sigma-70 factor (ECF subfamily)
VRDRLEQVYRQHRQGLFSVTLSITRNVAEAEDAVHDAFVRLARRVKPVSGDLTAYVYASVRNAALDRLRRRARAPEPLDSVFDEQAPRAESSEAGYIEDERGRLVREAVEQLPDAQRQAVVMKVYGGLTFQQIADACGEPLSTVSSRYQRALEALRKPLEVVA